MTSTEPLRVVVAINPAASFGRGHAVGSETVAALREAGHEVSVLTEPSYLELSASVQKACVAAPDALVVVGGDGMVHLAANVLVGSTVPLGIVPSGTGNDMARGLGIPAGNAADAIKQLLQQLRLPPRTIDLGRITRADGTQRHFAGVFSAGFDAIVNERANLMRWPKGKARYNVALLRELARLKPIRYRLHIDGELLETDAMLVAAANNTSFGGGMLVTPGALLDDGKLDVLVVGPLSRTAFLRIFPRVFAGTHISDPRVAIHQATSVRIEADAVVAYADGERVGPLPLQVDVAPAALRVLAPPG